MSDMEACKGTVMKVKFKNGLSFKEKIETLLNMGYEFDPCEIDMDDEWLGHRSGFVSIGQDFYEIIEKEEFDYQSMSEASENEDGTIDFCYVFYNGGTCFGEMLEESIEGFKKGN